MLKHKEKKMSKEDSRYEGVWVKKANEEENNGRPWEKGGRVENIKHVKRTSQMQENDMAYNVAIKDDVAYDMATKDDVACDVACDVATYMATNHYETDDVSFCDLILFYF